MSEPGINQLPNFALFSPFSCTEGQQVSASASKQNRLEVIEETRIRRTRLLSACNSVQCATAAVAFPAHRATKNLQVAGSIAASSVRIPLSPPN
jgi:hypothetical protein